MKPKRDFTYRLRPSGERPRLGWAAAALALSLGTGCQLDVLKEPDMGTDSIEDPGLDPKSLFQAQVQPILKGYCNCHYTKQGTVDPFLANDTEYDTITTYGGGRFITNPPEMSLLLTKGPHSGPAFLDAQLTAVRAWLQSEAVARGKGMGTPTTPTVALRVGEFFISLEPLVQDPLASITFKLSQGAGKSYAVTNLQLNTGPQTGIHMKHPRLMIFTAAGATPEKSDPFSTVDVTTVFKQAPVTIGTGSLILTDLPASSARLAFAFEALEKAGVPQPPITCKNYAMFAPPVKDQLAACAVLCHSPTATDTRASQATNAFNMVKARSTADTDWQALCTNTLGRVNPLDPPNSVLLKQAQPAASGGTTNHPYKLTDSQFLTFKMQVQAWASGEK